MDVHGRRDKRNQKLMKNIISITEISHRRKIDVKLKKLYEIGIIEFSFYSTVTDLARLRGLSTSQPLRPAA